MVPATMCRFATVAWLCAAVTFSLVVLACAQVAQADTDTDAVTVTTDDWAWSWDDAFANAAIDDTPTTDLMASASLSTDATMLTANVLAAPALTASGETLTWDPSVPTSTYVLVRKIAGQADQYSLVSGTSFTPPAVPGTTVRYSVRANVAGSAWAPEVSITYPADEGGGSPPDPATNTKAAPVLSVSGLTVQWKPVSSVASYVFVRKVPGQTAQYSLVSGTSVTPAAVPGKTVNYSVRTNVTGSTWAPEVSIAYASTSGGTTSGGGGTSTPIDGTFRMGVVSGSDLSFEQPFISQLGAHAARLEFGIGTSASSMASVMDQYAKAGIRPLLLASFGGRLPTTSEAQNLGSWAAAYGPGGSFWQGKSYAVTPGIAGIEFGNETSYSYQFSDNSLSTYASRAQTYALRARDAANAVRTANARVGLLAQGDNAQQGTAWVTNMLKAVPNLGDLVSGWTIHPYGPSWATRIDSTINSAKAAGSRDLPIWITEWGLSSDNGRCLDDNYGFDKCMTYGEAASTLHSALSGMVSRYGSRLGAFYLFQANDQFATGTSTSRERYFGALQNTGAAKGAFTTEVKANLAVN